MNRKTPILVAIVAGLAVAFLGLSWLSGHLARKQLQAHSEGLAGDFPLLKVAERRVQGGLFASTEEVVYEFNMDLFRGILEQAEVHEVIAFDGEEPPRFTVRNHILHGPLPGFSSVGLARVETEFVLGEDTRQQMLQSIGTDTPVQMVTHLGFTGGGWVTVEGPAFEYVDADTREQLAWQGLQGRFEFSRGLDRFSGVATMPGMRAGGDDGSDKVFSIGEMRMEADMERAFGKLYTGTGSFTVAGISGSGFGNGGGSMKDLRYDFDFRRADDEYIDMILKMGVGSVSMQAVDLRDLHYDLSLRHLHGPTYAELVEKMQDLYVAGMTGDSLAMIGLAGVMIQHAPTLLDHEPELVVDRIAFTLPEGGANLAGRVRLKDFERSDIMQGAAALLPKLDATMDIWVSESLLRKDWGAGPSEAAMAADGTVAPSPGLAQLQGLQAQVAMLTEQGYVRRNGERLESRIEFRDGALTVNGQPMGGPPPGTL